MVDAWLMVDGFLLQERSNKAQRDSLSEVPGTV
jgi:hypothetical protein